MERLRNNNRLRERAALLLAGTVLSACFGAYIETDDTHGKASPEKSIAAAEAAPQHSTTPETLDDFSMIVIEDPTQNKPPRHSDAKIENAFSIADELITNATDGRISLPDTYEMLHEEIAPKGPEKLDGEVCYTTEELYDLGKSLQKVKDQHIALIINETRACHEDKAGAWAYPNENISVYPNVNGETVAHEIGHTLGLKHHSIIGCQDRDSLGYRVDERDIKTRFEEPGCGITRNEDGDINEYASWQSVMGSANSNQYTEAYHPLEIEKIAPDIVQVPLVSGDKEIVQPIRTSGRGVRGIKFAVPENHPLREIDAKIKTLSVTALQYKRRNTSTTTVEFSVTAVSDTMLYDVVTFPIEDIVLSEADWPVDLEGMRTVIYTDETLGVSIAAEKTKDGGVVLHATPMNK